MGTTGKIMTVFFVLLGTTFAGQIRYVDTDATGDNSGTSWANAYTTVQRALSAVRYGDEIRVAQGVYTPAGPSGGRMATFRLKNGVVIKGGYAGFDEPNPDARDVKAYETIFSGDLKRDDDGFSNNSENSYHVVTGSGTGGTAVLDGFTITGGNANAPVLPPSNWPNFYGGGMYVNNGSPTVTNCIFRGNSANREGGGMSLWSSNSNLINCVFEGNKSGQEGGGLCQGDGRPKLTNCLFIGNTAASRGGAIYNHNDCDPIITNCTISGNSARWHGGMSSDWHCNVEVINCIFWGNSHRQIAIDESTISVIYSNVQGGWPGQGNIDTDPRFEQDGYHLQPHSPCIDAGADAGVYTDIEGNVRPFDFPGVDNNGELPEFDMGAYELVPIDAEMKLAPQMLNCNSKGKWVKAHFVLPEEFLPEDVDVYAPAVAEPIGAESEYIEVFGDDDGPVKLEVAFDRQAFCDLLTDEDSLEITVIGSLTTGQYFYGTDTIEIKPRR